MNRTQAVISIHNAHFSLKECMELAEDLRRSGQYEHVDITSRIYCNGEYFAKVYVEPKSSSHDICEELFG